MNIMTVCGLAVTAAAFIVLFRQHKPEYSLALSLVAGVGILIAVLGAVTPVLEQINAFLSQAGMDSSMLEVLFKALGITFVGSMAVDLCKDAGEGMIASKVDFATRVAVLLCALPAFRKLLDMVVKLMS